MYNIKYEIGLNENGRPYIGLPEDYEQRPEDRFFALEICRYMFQDLLARKVADIDEETAHKMEESEALLGQLSDEVAAILYDMMKTQGELVMMMDSRYHILVNSVEERDALPEKDIIYHDKIFDRVEGLKIGVQEYDDETYQPRIDIYELKNGITNENWVKL